MKLALAGQPNVGKSVIFHRLTGLGVIISNYPGTTVDITRGVTHFRGQRVEIIDLPGTYSLEATSIDQEVAIRVLLEEKPDVIINIVDATNLERNLYLTLQILELGIPAVIALNQMDRARKLGIEINVELLERKLGVPVVPTVATKGIGIGKVAEMALKAVRSERTEFKVRYDSHIEDRISKLTERLKGSRKRPPIPLRTIAVQLLGNNRVIAEKCEDGVARDRYGQAGIISKGVTTEKAVKVPLLERLGEITSQPVIGLLSVFLVLAIIYFAVFILGGLLEGLITTGYQTYVTPTLVNLVSHYGLSGLIESILLEGINTGILSALAIIVPYILTFYLVIGLLEDTGLLARLAFLLDGVMHNIGLHGRAIIPMLLGCGCNVPAILSTRTLGSGKARLLTAVLISLAVPCSAQTAVILGLLG
ncbi:MAG: ferrous iron transport protein B [Candidatus Bathyarchaeia archaeon]